MEENERTEARPPADVSQVARDAHESAAIGSARPFAEIKKLRERANPKTSPRQDLAAARERMEQSILDRKKAMLHCGTCGSQGRWRTESVKKPKRSSSAPAAASCPPGATYRSWSRVRKWTRHSALGRKVRG